MKKVVTERDEIKIVGLSLRTRNDLELNPETSSISPLVNEYFEKGLANRIKQRIVPNKTYSIYTDYESDETGEYRYYIGEEVSSFSEQDLTLFSCLTIPKQRYQRFTTTKGVLPNIIIDAWQSIWAMNDTDLNDKRRYLADFEIFDERSRDPSNAEIDIYVGIAEGLDSKI